MSLTANLHLLLPEFLLAGLALLVFAIDLFLPANRKNLLAWFSVVAIIGIIIAGFLVQWGEDTALYKGLVIIDSYTLFFQTFFLILGAVVILASMEYLNKHLAYPGEYYALVILSILAMTAMAASRELLTAYISLELMSFCFYIMASYARDNPKSNEAGVKYILIGGFSSAILLFGLSMLYGVLGVTSYADIAAQLELLQGATGVSPALWVGLAPHTGGLGLQDGQPSPSTCGPPTYTRALPFP